MILPPWDRKATEIEQCELLAALVRCLKPRVVVESGTYTGFSALYMAAACKANGHGKVFTADPVDHVVEKWAAANQIGAFLSYYQGDFAEMLENLGEKADFAYIDGSAAGPKGAILRSEHFKLVKERFLNPGGIICADDTATGGWADGEKGKSANRITQHCLNFRFLRGLSIYYEPTHRGS